MKKRWILLLILLAAVVYFWRIEPQWLQTSEYTLSSAQLPPAFSGLRIVEIADLHGEMFGEEHAHLLRAVREVSPDVIAIDGDFFDERTDVSTLDPLLTGLTEIAPVYYVTGNHEWTVSGLPDILAHFEELGITVLANEYVTLERSGERIALAGVHDPNGPYDMKTKEQLVMV